MVNSPLIRPYLLGGVALGGGTLDSHDSSTKFPGLKKGNSNSFKQKEMEFFGGYTLGCPSPFPVVVANEGLVRDPLKSW